ncbi:hypothetical protein D3C80_1989310 [compost metagenome]
MRGVALEHAVANLTLRILDQKTALGTLDKNDKGNHANSNDNDSQNERRRQCACTA